MSLLVQFLYQSLPAFRQVFPRRRTFVTFCLVLLGLLGAGEMVGISSLCRLWHMGESGYHRLLHFFHSTGWSAALLGDLWNRWVLCQGLTVQVTGRAILIGDHTYEAKDGRRMPGVVTLHQESETQTKSSFFRGHQFGVLGLLIGSLQKSFCLPLQAELHQGFRHLGEKLRKKGKKKKDTVAIRLLQMALRFAQNNQLFCTLVLDAFFSVAPVFEFAASALCPETGKPYLHIVTRAKKNYVAYQKPPKQKKKKSVGRPRKYGKKIKLKEVFNTHEKHFKKRLCLVYGKLEVVSYFSMNLLWSSFKKEVRFIFVKTSRGPLILMCSDLHIRALTALKLYCARVRIETTISVLKNVIRAFAYRFWSKRLPKHSRRPKKNSKLKKPRKKDLKTVRRCWEAYERFVTIGCIAVGLLQILSLKFPFEVWNRFCGFLRTRHRFLPSENTVKQVVATMLVEDFHKVAPSATMQEIRPHSLREVKPAQNDHGEDESMADIA